MSRKKKTRLAVKRRAYVIHTRKDNDSRGNATRGSVLNKNMLSLKKQSKFKNKETHWSFYLTKSDSRWIKGIQTETNLRHPLRHFQTHSIHSLSPPSAGASLPPPCTGTLSPPGTGFPSASVHRLPFRLREPPLPALLS